MVRLAYAHTFAILRLRSAQLTNRELSQKVKTVGRPYGRPRTINQKKCFYCNFMLAVSEGR
jgi:hypothetical protein